MNLPVMEVTLVKAAGPGGRDGAWLTVAGVTRPGPVHVVHDLPHLAVESLFGIGDGCGQNWPREVTRRPAMRPRPATRSARSGGGSSPGSGRCPGHGVPHPR